MKIEISKLQNAAALLKKNMPAGKMKKMNESEGTMSFEENAEEDLSKFSPEKTHEILKDHLVSILKYYKNGEFLKDSTGKTAKKILWDFMSSIS